MKKIVMLMGSVVVLLLVHAGCVVGVDTGVGDACEPVSCQDAVSGGLEVQGSPLCDGVSDATYLDLTDCACNGACPECDDNLCTDSGMDGACAACIADVCGSANDACGAN